LLGDDLIGVNVCPIHGNNAAGVGGEGFHENHAVDPANVNDSSFAGAGFEK
jgi:hypothetical protein